MVEKAKTGMEAREEKSFVKGLSLSNFNSDGNPSVVNVKSVKIVRMTITL